MSGWDGTTPSIEEYGGAAKRLVEKSLTTGDHQMLLDVKTLMDRCSATESRIKRSKIVCSECEHVIFAKGEKL